MDGKIQDFLEKLKNKITYYIYKTVNDDDANKYVEEQKEQEKVKENYAKQPAKVAKPADTDGKESTTDTVIRYVQLVIIPVISFILAVFVANELIVYPTAVRVIFFLITIILCNINNAAFGLLLAYYICAGIAHWYINRKRDKMPQIPFIRILPKIFGWMPFYPYDAEEKVTGFLSYLKPSNKDLKNENTGKTELDTLKEVIANYRESLSKSFPYYENVKDDDVFVMRMKDVNEYFKELTETKYSEEDKNNAKNAKNENNAKNTKNTVNNVKALSEAANGYIESEKTTAKRPNGEPLSYEKEQLASLLKKPEPSAPTLTEEAQSPQPAVIQKQ
jgi:hypothetical protein